MRGFGTCAFFTDDVHAALTGLYEKSSANSDTRTARALCNDRLIAPRQRGWYGLRHGNVRALGNDRPSALQ
ncbi:hypothetical protein Y032_0089g2230 [Ancylostoma ceylanicum]|uniref:Uncharacterized protein n=1 Tax=Ancylostoma ceylanicum TaxID=53326 RepID=A0A016TNU7_9BILA|nr:hypothetical protein Y032_0089g2230 [Ancylostoma ceylanicum]